MRVANEKQAWAEYLGVSWFSARRWNNAMLNQLCHCKSDEARRLITGASYASEQERLRRLVEISDSKMKHALEIACSYGSIEGEHHKTWVIDQMVRSLLGIDYENWVNEHNAGEDGPETYAWNQGIAP